MLLNNLENMLLNTEIYVKKLQEIALIIILS